MMKIKNIFLLIVQLFVLLLTGVCVVFCQTSVISSRVVSKEEAAAIIAYCQGKSSEPNDEKYANVQIFDKYGKKYKSLREIRSWDLQKEERDKRLDIVREHSRFFDQLLLSNVVECGIEQSTKGYFSDSTEMHQALVQGTADTSVCQNVRQYFESK